MATHQAIDNFYNERAFAERLHRLSVGQQIPETAREEFVETVVTCSVGNQYGTANSADGYYQSMVKDFSPKEIQVMLTLPDSNTIVANRIKYASRCKEKFKSLVALLQASSVPNQVQAVYKSWL
jgi:hypothetical protein